MKKLLLLGDDAIAQAALDAGISGIYAYPGTPSTEITEYVHNSLYAKQNNVRSNWSTNEKTAMESALGMSYSGKRAMVCMKHVGLNVAADAFINSALTGVNGGLIVVVADDPSMHSSQNEQDSRFYAKFSFIPCLEPSNQQEAYDMVIYGFELSEKYQVPVMLRITTRLAHSRSDVKRIDTIRNQNDLSLPKNLKQFILLPAIAKVRYRELLANQIKFERESLDSGYNLYKEGTDNSLGIITSGIAYNYLLENFEDRNIPFNVLKIAQYPVPVSLLEKVVKSSDKILVLEEGYPIIEEMLRGSLNNGGNIQGRLDGTVPRDGELNPNIVALALNIPIVETESVSDIVLQRPPSLCVGCPHIDTYNALNETLLNLSKGRVFSDIGCYTLGALPPYNAINSCVDMGASITMAKGAADAGLHPSVAVIGDSTFTHSGMTGLLDCINDNSAVTIFILDNETTAMTGGQKSSANGKIENICIGLGLDKEHIRVIKPLKNKHEENVKVITEELNYKGTSVIIAKRECIQTLNKRMREKFKNKNK